MDRQLTPSLHGVVGHSVVGLRTSHLGESDPCANPTNSPLLFVRVLHHDVHDFIAGDLLDPVRHSGGYPDEIAFREPMFFAALNSRSPNLARLGLSSSHYRASRYQGAAAVDHIPHVRLALVHLGFSRLGATKQN